MNERAEIGKPLLPRRHCKHVVAKQFAAGAGKARGPVRNQKLSAFTVIPCAKQNLASVWP